MTTQEEFINILKSGNIIDEKFIFNFIQEFVNINHLGNSVIGVSFLGEKDTEFRKKMNAPAAYGSNNWIYIDYNKMLLGAMRYYKINSLNISSEKLTNLNLIIIKFLYHELTHAKQNDMINGFSSENKDIDKLLENSANMAIKLENGKLYDKYHDLFLNEYNANITSAFLTDFFYDKIVEMELKEFNPYIYEFVLLYLYYGYVDNSPLEKYNKITNQDFKPVEGLELFDKICYGMPIDENEKCKVKSLRLAKECNTNLISYLNNKEKI